MTSIYLLLGTNLGNKSANLQRAKELLTSHAIIIKKESRIYETAAWGNEDQPSFLNQVVEVDSNKSPQRILTLVNQIEEEMGRVRFEKWGERLIDIDILYFGSHEIQNEDLVIPHPEIQNRRFTLAPLAEIAPSFIHPVLKKTQQELLDDCVDLLEVTVWEPVYS
ncbi:2-amino-4-hydroxy-6-hydroxymethyldihydropteridine diphosphokinase [Roseivirga pacifica]|uniref:2-amino-4-hydroxy-6- hydroxymethyldihydropteridine diphosphokinase n=1 Tax=Roseivirga pacifica TaxID=1267423 RepID=UPI002095121B|nr:2-amino-4-hydroxy-6-hydroxymethyldihydropteridine diphosphokinase [Roseivirga pacifica]MCO6358348.1 2-amino-4-hydroxy-6-hydroxymethyldihydropteridine diphosphokinase [Roseivirga pacifica]MCO6366188.1 2-amino-4-hydroxy-6-hydroxymethyldihydropteridine diphosphokinase [Roseivirga pacifica]MCO6369261.1 2-amino-4-hydroxy-6-hydroxymethyldihydropteridine diphosphokinase [Roseivirga pacifica]MCO6374079.1 2-amino-4-hydroxy-6-hydroxymethyldihydropteridine diphosphokinase [Roseivirga pacifica]MCO63784